MSKRNAHRWAHIAMVAVSVVGGAALGYAAWLGITLQITERTLRMEARQRMDRSDRYPTEALSFLREMNGLSEAPCSQSDVARFRRMLMKGNYVKEAGRMEGKKLACSAILPASQLPDTEYSPSFPDAGGVLVYNRIAALKIGGRIPIVMRLGDAYVALDPGDRDDNRNGTYFTLTARNASVGGTFLGGNTTHLPGDVLIKDGFGRSGGDFFATACSLRYPPCVTATLPLGRVLAEQRHHFAIAIAVGAALGCWLGFIWASFVRLRRGIEHQLRRAVRRGALGVVYQPLVDIGTGAVLGAEALVRWTDQDGVSVAPDTFIKLAEQCGFLNEITQLVVRRVLADFAPYLVAHPAFTLNVNVAASDLADPDFHHMLDLELLHAQVMPGSLGIELTESATARHDEAIEAIASLRRRGHHVYIDDFGTGYSSLAYLKDLAVDGIKIDRAFTQAIGTDAVTVGILPQIMKMAETLKLSVVAEGVETEAQAAYYRNFFEPPTGQGWLYGLPLAAHEFGERWLGMSVERTLEKRTAKLPWRPFKPHRPLSLNEQEALSQTRT